MEKMYLFKEMEQKLKEEPGCCQQLWCRVVSWRGLVSTHLSDKVFPRVLHASLTKTTDNQIMNTPKIKAEKDVDLMMLQLERFYKNIKYGSVI